jgi:hypothetical protein
MPPKALPDAAPVAPPTPWYVDPATGGRVEGVRPPSGGGWSADPATGERILDEPPPPPVGQRWDRIDGRFRLVPDTAPGV